MKSCWAVLTVAILTASCGGDTPAAPSAPPVPSCQANNTAQLSLQNISVSRLTFDVLIDNIGRGTAAPNQRVGPFTLSAGVNHTIVFRFTNTSLTACAATTSFAACSTQTLTCDR